MAKSPSPDAGIELTPRIREDIHDRLPPPPWGFWKGVLAGLVIEVPALAAAVWLAGQAGLADPSVPFMHTIRMTAVFAGIAAVLTAGGIGRLAAHASVTPPEPVDPEWAGEGGRRRAAWIAGRAHAAASAGLIVIAAIPGGGLPMDLGGWLGLVAIGALCGLACGAAIGVVCGGAAPVGLGDVISLARRPSDVLKQFLDPEDLLKLGAAVRARTTHLFDGMFEPGPARPTPVPPEAGGEPVEPVAASKADDGAPPRS